MPDPLQKISGGTIYDPANGVDGAIGDIWIDGRRIVAAPDRNSTRPVRTLDAAGLIVMPGGVDMHCHIAGPKVNAARRMRPEEQRAAGSQNSQSAANHSGSLPSVPTSFVTGARYAGLGYTTAFDAAIAPLTAQHAHLELAATPYIDRGCFLLMGNNHYLMESIGRGETEHTRSFIAWLLRAGKGFAPKVVNPGGVEAWKSGRGADPVDLDTVINGFQVTPRQILSGIATAANELNLPHPLHVHANHLGIPGNWATTLETMKSLDGRRVHLAHIQFHSYGGSPTKAGTFCSQVAPLVDWFNEHDNLSVDVGQVLFGPTTSMTGDSAVGHYLSRLRGARWYSHDVECEAGCGVVPIEYRPHSLIHAWQWAIGLEWFLLARDPWRIALSTDHPNGGSFTAYPEIIRLLMDRTYRADMLRKVHHSVREKSVLSQLDRQYTLNEICIITRAAPARLLGLKNNGHLGPGADADVTLYSPGADPAETFQLPRHVLKAGEFVVENGELRQRIFGQTLHVAPPFDPADEPHIHDWINDRYSIRAANYPVDPLALGANREVEC